MPILPEDRPRYPERWPLISQRIRSIRAEGRCECSGECGRAHPGGRCEERDGERARWSKDKPVTVVLTVAHLDHQPENNHGDNLRAMCQRCHLTHDAEHHYQTRVRRQREALESAGQLTLSGDPHEKGQGHEGSKATPLDGAQRAATRSPTAQPRDLEVLLRQREASAWGQLELPAALPKPKPLDAKLIAVSGTYRQAMDAAARFKGGAAGWDRLKRLYLAAFVLADGSGALRDALAHSIAPVGSLWQLGRGRARWQVVRFDPLARQLTLRSDGAPKSRRQVLPLPQLFGAASRWRRVQ